jgi:hypothetical protein
VKEATSKMRVANSKQSYECTFIRTRIMDVTRTAENGENYLTKLHNFYFYQILKNSIFWDITPCSPLRVNRRFGKTKQSLPPAFTFFPCLTYSSTLKTETTVLPTCQLTFNGLHGVISQKIQLFVRTSASTSNHTLHVLLGISFQGEKMVGPRDKHEGLRRGYKILIVNFWE